jgi:hypothetical protein
VALGALAAAMVVLAGSPWWEESHVAWFVPAGAGLIPVVLGAVAILEIRRRRLRCRRIALSAIALGVVGSWAGSFFLDLGATWRVFMG